MFFLAFMSRTGGVLRPACERADIPDAHVERSTDHEIRADEKASGQQNAVPGNCSAAFRSRFALIGYCFACVMVTAWSPMISVPVRAAPVVFGSALTARTSGPDASGLGTEIHDGGGTMFGQQLSRVGMTVIVAIPPPAANSNSDRLTVAGHGSGALRDAAGIDAAPPANGTRDTDEAREDGFVAITNVRDWSLSLFTHGFSSAVLVMEKM
jgi:hypothetical protein